MPPPENETPAIHAPPSGQQPSRSDTPSVTGSSGSYTLEGVPTLQPDAPGSADTGDWSGLDIGSRYLVGERLGEGGMGVVYLAEDRHLGDAAVIKRPHRHLVADTAAVDRFLREVRSLITLRHPHICHVRDAGQHAGVPFVVMDYLSGGSLAERIAGFQPGRLPRDVLAWLPDIAKALDFVHRQGHVHRDVKPANILFDEHGNAYLGDFGIAKALSQEHAAAQTPSLTRTGAFIGTPEYTAPEVFLGERYGVRADQYALAAVIYELLCGRRPFDGPTPFAISVLQATTTPILPHEINTAVPEGISQALLQAMSRDADKRFASCQQFVQAIKRGRKQAATERTVAAEVVPAAPAAATPRAPSRPQVKQPEPLSVITNSIDMKMLLIPAGEFLMGSPENDSDAGDSEKPPHRVRITQPFYLGVYPVTQAEYQRVMGENPSRFQGNARRPVKQVSWEDAIEFCRRLSAQEGKTYRLPTEAEWEYACRAGSTGRWCFGDDESVLEQYAWYKRNSGMTHSVGQKKPNSWGLYDMHGNVWEWCADWYERNYYKQFAEKIAVDPTGPSGGWLRVYRGGCWCCVASVCRAAFRVGWGPSARRSDLGFRLAMTVP